MSLFLTGFIQVLLVSLNVWQVSHGHFLSATVVGFLISLVWTFNVKKVAFGNHLDRITYASGAALGTLAGMLIARTIYG